jgi:large subunit ribosomal protein L22
MKEKIKSLRIVGVTIPEDDDIFNGLKKIKGLSTEHSENKIERILTKAGLYTYKMKDTRTDKTKGAKPTTAKRSFVKVYPKVADLSWKEKARLIDLLEMPRAILRNIHTSPKKLRLVADAIRGKKVDEALAMLQFMEKGGAPTILKLLKSAIANAGANHELRADDLYVAKITIDGAATMKRFMARARGRAARIRCRTSHAKIVLRETNEAIYRELKKETAATAAKKSVKKVAKKAATKKTAAKAQGGKE